MAHLGLKLGRHSVQAALWRSNVGVAVEAHLAGLEVESGSWKPVLAQRILDGAAVWGSDVWSRLHEVSLSRRSLLEHLQRPERGGGWSPEVREILAGTLWPELARISGSDRAGGRSALCIASTVPVTDSLRSALCTAAPASLGLTPERIVEASPCALLGRRQEGRTLPDGFVLHLHLGGTAAQAHLWEVEESPSRLLLHRLAWRGAREAGLGVILDSVYRKVVGEWGFLWVDHGPDAEREEEIIAKIRRHVTHLLARDRANWGVMWRYEVPVDYRLFAQWRHGSGPAVLPGEQVKTIIDRAGDRLMQLIDGVLSGAGVSRAEVKEVVATGAGASDYYLLPRLEREFGAARCPASGKAEVLPALGAAALAYFSAAESPLRVEIRDGMNIGVELEGGEFDPLLSENGDGWDEMVRVYEVPPGLQEIVLRAGVRRVNQGLPPLARLPVPAGAGGEVGVRVWRSADGWWAETRLRSEPAAPPVPLTLPGEKRTGSEVLA